jgi:hypothetical protein
MMTIEANAMGSREEGKDLEALWRQMVQDYDEIRREQEEEWASLSLEERIQLAEQLILLIQEAKRVERSVNMQEMLLHLQEIFDEFPKYVIIGGIAAMLLGTPRTTVDVEVVLLLPFKEAKRVVELFEQYGFHPGSDAVAKLSAGRPAKFAFSRRFSADVRLASFSLDRAAIRRAQVVPLFGCPLGIATPEDLIVYKLASWKAVDREDIRHILQCFGDSLDTAYLEEQIRLLSQEAGLPDLLERWISIK